jgi:hypothetical protein
MKIMKRTTQILLIICLYFSCSTQQRVIQEIDTCELIFLKSIEEEWKEDSLLTKGFRQTICELHDKSKCKLYGYDWLSVKSFLGEPDHNFDSDEYNCNRYKLNGYDENYVFGQAFLDVYTINDTISNFECWISNE